MISGLAELLSSVGITTPTGDAGFVAGNIILGGDGGDIIEGRGGDDVIDGDAWLNVRINGGILTALAQRSPVSTA